MAIRNSKCSCASLLEDIEKGSFIQVRTTCNEIIYGNFEKVIESDVIQLRNLLEPAVTRVTNICCNKICSITKLVSLPPS